jgi:hypothetical protein
MFRGIKIPWRISSVPFNPSIGNTLVPYIENIIREKRLLPYKVGTFGHEYDSKKFKLKFTIAYDNDDNSVVLAKMFITCNRQSSDTQYAEFHECKYGTNPALYALYTNQISDPRKTVKQLLVFKGGKYILSKSKITDVDPLFLAELENKISNID